MKNVRLFVLLGMMLCAGSADVFGQAMKAADLEKYAKQRYGDKWLDAAMNLSKELVLDKNESLTYQEVVPAPGKTKSQLYVALNYWATATFQDKQNITLNDKEAGCIIISSPINGIADHMGTMNRYVVNITPIIRLDIKDEKVRVTYTVQTYDILKASDAGWIGMLADNSNNRQNNQNIYSDGKRMKDDMTDRRLFDEQWEIAKHYPFVEKDAQKRTCSKALVMTHAYSNAILDKVTEAVRNGVVGGEDDDW